ncbi:restriction endonuclease subunit S [Rhodoferax bucti]|uniref:restriction endonuclease subunit S n=1 Tax=Rhodoferax bucti TaxID=2576305 RepID=UPI00198111F2|nr:restriction endonuclease subunit S [Rhodoferax bucti]
MSVAGKPGYKETVVGWIPVEWTLGKLGDFVAALQAGVSVNANETEAGCLDGQVGVLKTSAVLGGKFFAHQHKVVVPEDIDRVASPVLADRVVISRMNTPALVGESGYVPSAQPHLFLPDRLWQTVPSDRPHSQRWLSYWLQLPAIKSLIAAGATGTSNSMKNISKDVLLTLPTPHTPFPEQQKIAAILTAVDDKLDLIARQISATQTLKQGLMQTLFTRGAGTPDAQGRWHPHTEFQDSPIGQIPQNWEARKLEELATENITYGVVQPGEVSAGGVPLVRGGDIKNGKIAANLRTVSQEISVQFKRTVLQGGELLVSLVGYPGETAVVPEELAGANIARQAGMIRTSSLAMSKFIHCYLASTTGRACLLGGMIGSAQQVINLKSLREVYVPMPAEAERDQISTICEEVFNKLNVLTTQQTHYQSLKRGLMQKLLTGEWRVRVEAVAA